MKTLHIVTLITVFLVSACTSTGGKKTSKELFALLDKADNAYSDGNWLEAEMYYQQLLEKVPTDSYAWLRIGNARLQTGQIDAAIAAYNESITQNPNEPKPYYNLSTAYMLQAQRTLETAKDKMQSHDPGISLVNQRINGLKDLATGKYSDQVNNAENETQSNRITRFFMPSR